MTHASFNASVKRSRDRKNALSSSWRAARSTQSLGGSVPIFLAAYVTHALRVILAAVMMLAVWVVAWLVAGVAARSGGQPTSTAVLIGSIVAASLGFGVGAYISATRITPGSLLHPVVAAAALGTAFVAILTSGDMYDIAPVLIVAPCVPALIGALLARTRRTPPDRSLEGSRDR